MINHIKPNIGLWISLNMNYRYYSLETSKHHCRCNRTRILLCRKFCANQWCRRRGASTPIKVLICWNSEQNLWISGQNLWKSWQKWRPTLFDFKWRRTFAEKHKKTVFGGHPKWGLHDLWGTRFVGKVAQNFSSKFWKIRAKILRTPTNFPAPTPMVLTMQLPQHSTCKLKQHFSYTIVSDPRERKQLHENEYNSHESEMVPTTNSILTQRHVRCW